MTVNPYEKALHDPNQYVVQTHYENRDRGQGSMFRVQPWRRGYGPTRSRSIEASGIKVNAAGVEFTGRLTGKGGLKEATQQARGQATRDFVDQLKRSSIPAGHLNNLTINLRPMRGYAAGTYHWGEIDMDPPRRGDFRDVEGKITHKVLNTSDVMAHEIGHHVGQPTDRARADRFTRTPEEREPQVAAMSKPAYAGQYRRYDGERPTKPQAREWAEEETTRRLDFDAASGPGAITGVQEGFADSYQEHHTGPRPSSSYTQKDLVAETKNRMRGRFAEPSRFNLGPSGEGQQAVRAYTAERHRWGQETGWETRERLAAPMSGEQFPGIPGQQQFDLR